MLPLGCCYPPLMKKVLCYQLECGKLLPRLRLNASVVKSECFSRYQGKSEEVLLFALLRIHIIGSQRLERFAPPSLPPHLCNPATRDFKSSILVEALL